MNMDLEGDGDDDLELVPRNCILREPYVNLHVPSFEVSGAITAFASPDSTWSVTKRILASAKRSILIGIYDFTAKYVKEILIDAIKRDVSVSLMLDLDHRSGEDEIFDELVELGCDGVSAPSCANALRSARWFRSSHQKVIVVDGRWTFVQSGNYSDSSIPQNEGDGLVQGSFQPGNRDMGVVVESKELAIFFTQLLESDMDLTRQAQSNQELPEPPLEPWPPLLEAAPARRPPLVASKTFALESPIGVTPVLTPDNYMEVIPQLLASAQRSIRIQQQYIRGREKDIRVLLDAIAQARRKNDGLEVRLIVAAPMGARAFAKETDNMAVLANDYDLHLGTHIRILNPALFVHCHNKLIVVDEAQVLVSSQNWSTAAVRENREAGLLIPYPPLAQYFTQIFDGDWQSALPELVKKAVPRTPTEETPGANLIRVNPGDYDSI
jgi:phosphatidylserine/phosphatidylglycerophosphate/cardiolipin synthase-like enzyme